MDAATTQIVKDLLAQGKSREEVKAALIARGTDATTADELLTVMHPVPAPEPLPTPSSQPVLSPATSSTAPTKSPRKLLGRPKMLIPLGVIVLLVVSGVILHARAVKMKNATAGSQATSPSAATQNPNQAATSNTTQPTTKGYFATVVTDLGSIDQLGQAMDQSCAVKFPPPQPCMSDIQAYQQELLATKTDLSQVSAPTSFQQADTTMRGALNTDIQASDQALTALQGKNLGPWLDALTLHGQAAQQLGTAFNQAQSAAN